MLSAIGVRRPASPLFLGFVTRRCITSPKLSALAEGHKGLCYDYNRRHISDITRARMNKLKLKKPKWKPPFLGWKPDPETEVSKHKNVRPPWFSTRLINSKNLSDRSLYSDTKKGEKAFGLPGCPPDSLHSLPHPTRTSLALTRRIIWRNRLSFSYSSITPDHTPHTHINRSSIRLMLSSGRATSCPPPRSLFLLLLLSFSSFCVCEPG